MRIGNHWLAGAALLAAFHGAPESLAARPSDPFILRAVMREKPRMILVALHAGLSVAYDAQTCGLYQAWKGGMQDGNATYHHQTGGNRGATYYPKGKLAFWQRPGGEMGEDPPADTRATSFSPKNEELIQVWSAARDGQALAVRADYAGYDINHAAETAVLRYAVVLPDGARIKVGETPEYSAAGGAAGLQRDIAVQGIPAGVSVALVLTGNPIRKADGALVAETWIVNTGSGKLEKRAGKDVLVFAADGQTRITGTWR